MIPRDAPFIITGTSPAAPGLAVIGSVLPGLAQYDWFQVDATLTGATGGVLDLCLQRLVSLPGATNVWFDWLHFAQLGAGAAAVNLSFSVSPAAAGLVTVGQMADSPAGTFTLAANSYVGGHPGHALRLVAIAGASTSAGAAQKVYVTPFKTIT